MFNETHADALAALRRWGKCHFARSAKVREFCDRLEAAHKREMSKIVSKNGADFGQLGDAARLREALTKVKEWMAHRIATGGFEASATVPTMLEDVVLPALSAPPRNCDVGTARQQDARYNKLCEPLRSCGQCPVYVKAQGVDHCEFVWAQMPYEEGGAE